MHKLKQALLWIVSIAVALLVLLAVPWTMGGPSFHASPVQDYAAAAQQIQKLRDSEQSAFNPDCAVDFMTHGRQVTQAIVFVHGATTCPMQFHALGQQFYDLGYNVLIAPLPHHGLADRMTTEQSRLTAGELAAYADQMVDIARGLGQHVTMVGISGGGVTTAWAATGRADLDLAVIISPAFGFKQIPTAMTVPAVNAILFLPDSYTWWDPTKQINTEPTYAYPQYSMHALAQIARLGFGVQNAAREAPPAARRIVIVLNGGEPAVNNELTEQVLADWQQHGANVTSYEFPADLQLPHDLVDPSQPDQNTDVVYPKLIQLISQ